jgi:Holliday junction resolvasome RuvABC ATP-dependent DNA helicase subunit
MRSGDILKIEEIHQQAIMERRGRSSATQPEVFYAIMEDRVIPTATGILPYPEITVLGTTTDEGMLPDSFVMRFPLKPRLVPYTLDDAKQIAAMNAERLDLQLDPAAADIFAHASRQLPREVNNLMRYAAILGAVDGRVSEQDALETLTDTGVTRDGLTADMQAMLTQLYTKGRRESADGEVRYQASVTTIATLIGKSRDAKAVQLRVEPYLIERGYVQVLHGGRALTDAGVERARRLLEGA